MMNVANVRQGDRQDPIAFSLFRLDRRAGQLTRAGLPVALRPKTWAVLVYLAERPGVLVTKDELLDAVWPDIAVTPDTLNKSIGELRVALRDDSKMPRFIETVHRRGFRFIGAPGPAAVDDAVPPRGGDAGARPFVGRAAELRQLAEHFRRACAGERQIVFVTGPAGVGKTTLLEAFFDSLVAGERTTPVWIGRGTCVEQHGPREPYLSVLDAVERLARRPDAQRLVDLLRRVAPAWLAQIPWLTGDEPALRGALQAVRPERMLREFAAFAELLAADVPLVLVLEDLHWSDPSTVDLLSVLGQRGGPARLLVIGTYRPAEVAVQEHPLSHGVRTLRLRRQCTELPVHELSEADVGQYLAERFPGADLPPTLARMLHAHTDGNALFVTAVVEHMLSRGWILETAPGWSFTAPPGPIDLGVPDDARRMIATQYESLSPADRRLLDAASVAGGEFVAPAIATAMGCAVDDVEVRCEALATAQRFLRFAGSGEWPGGRVVPRYAFAHELYRQAVYEEIPAGGRERLHRRIGETIEAAWGGRATEIAAELATHFERGRDYARALRYFVAAAARARQRFASREAIGYLEAAIGLATQVPDAGEKCRLELEVRIALAPILNDSYGFASRELSENCQRAYELCTQVGSPVQLFQVLYALCHVHSVRGAAGAKPMAAELADLAGRLGTAEYRLLADTVLARLAAHEGHFTEVCRLAEGPLATSLRRGLSERPPAYGADPVVATNCHYAYALWFLGHAERARTVMSAALDASAGTGVSPFTRAAALTLMTVLELLCRNPAEVRRLAEEIDVLSAEHGFRFWNAMAAALKAWARVQEGELRRGIEDLARARDALAATGARTFSTHVFAFLAEAHLRAGEFASGLAAADEGLRVAETTLDRSYWPELWRLKGELLLGAATAGKGGARRLRRADARSALGAGRGRNEAETCLKRALEMARKSRAKSLELRAATSLARAWRASGRAVDALRMLDPLCRWFRTCPANRDLAEARALLTRLRAGAPSAPRRRAGRSAAPRAGAHRHLG